MYSEWWHKCSWFYDCSKYAILNYTLWQVWYSIFLIWSLNIFKSDSSIFGSITKLNDLTLGAQNNDIIGSFFSFNSEAVYDLQDASHVDTIIHLLYFYDEIEDEENTISSPGANVDESVFPGQEFGLRYWTTRRTMRFKNITNNITVKEFTTSIHDSLLLAKNDFANA